MGYMYDGNISDVSNYGCITAIMTELGDFMCQKFYLFNMQVHVLIYYCISWSLMVYVYKDNTGWAGELYVPKCAHFQLMATFKELPLHCMISTFCNYFENGKCLQNQLIGNWKTNIYRHNMKYWYSANVQEGIRENIEDSALNNQEETDAYQKAMTTAWQKVILTTLWSLSIEMTWKEHMKKEQHATCFHNTLMFSITLFKSDTSSGQRHQCSRYWYYIYYWIRWYS